MSKGDFNKVTRPQAVIEAEIAREKTAKAEKTKKLALDLATAVRAAHVEWESTEQAVATGNIVEASVAVLHWARAWKQVEEAFIALMEAAPDGPRIWFDLAMSMIERRSVA